MGGNKNTIKNTEKEIEAMLGAGVHFGHKKTFQHPKMSPYIFALRNAISIINLEKTEEGLLKAIEYIKNLLKDGKTIWFVDTKPSTKEETKKLAEEIKMPYIIERWAGGTITNWKTISKRLEYLEDMEKKRKSEEWNKYTKKERSDMEEEIKKLGLIWGGIRNIKSLPDAIFVTDMKKNGLAIKEANKKNITVVGIADTNIDPTKATYPIPANDDAISSVRYVLKRIKNGIISK